VQEFVDLEWDKQCTYEAWYKSSTGADKINAKAEELQSL
jgi:hypothetical protein